MCNVLCTVCTMRATFCLDIQTFECMGWGSGGRSLNFATSLQMQLEESAETVKLPIIFVVTFELLLTHA